MYVLLSVPESVALADARSVLLEHLGALAGALLVAFVLAWLGGRTLVLKPVHRLVSASEQLGEGALMARAGPPYRAGEIGDLARSFDAMAAALEQRASDRDRTDRALRRSEADNRSLIDNAPYGILRSNVEGRLLQVNPALVTMLGYDSAQELMSKNLGEDVYLERPSARPGSTTTGTPIPSAAPKPSGSARTGRGSPFG